MHFVENQRILYANSRMQGRRSCPDRFFPDRISQLWPFKTPENFSGRLSPQTNYIFLIWAFSLPIP